MEIKKDMVFEYLDEEYMKYFIPQKLSDNYWYGVVLDENFNIISWAGYNEDRFNDKDDFKLAEKTLDTLWAGDILEEGNQTYYKRVIQRIGNIVFIGSTQTNIEDLDSFSYVSDTSSIEELKHNENTILPKQETKVEELTMEEVCEQLGKTIKIKK